MRRRLVEIALAGLAIALPALIALHAGPSSAEDGQAVCVLAKASGSVNVNTSTWQLPTCCSGSACTASSGTLSSTGKYMLQCIHEDWTCVVAGRGVSLSASCLSDAGVATGTRIPSKQFYDLKLNGSTNIAVIRADAGVVDCNVFAVTP